MVLSIVPALADDWVATRLRGEVLQLVDGAWQPLVRSAVVSDDRFVRTSGNGRVAFQRDGETIELGPNTQIRIIDREGERFTTVRQNFGTVTIEAEVQNVQHFAVETPFLAAVVKGTKFVVTSGKTRSSVKVNRGAVAVEDAQTHRHVVVTVGQTATVAGAGNSTTSLSVSGQGKLPKVEEPEHDDGLVSDTVEVVDGLLDGLLGNGHGNGNAGGHGNGSGNSGSGNNGNGNSGHGGGNEGGGNSGGNNSGSGGGGGGSGGLIGGVLGILL